MNIKKNNKKLLICGTLLSFIVIALLLTPVIPTYTEIGELDINTGNVRKYTVFYGIESKKQISDTDFAILLSKNTPKKKTHKWEKFYTTQYFILGKTYTCYEVGSIPPKLNLLAQFLKSKSKKEQKETIGKCISLLSKKKYRDLDDYINTILQE